jgi:hypothetical protein
VNARWIYRSKLAQIIKVEAIVLYPFILTQRPPERVDARLYAHEMKHVEQILRDGWGLFYAKYLYFYAMNLLIFRDFREAYLQIPYEIEARAAESTSRQDR